MTINDYQARSPAPGLECCAGAFQRDDVESMIQESHGAAAVETDLPLVRAFFAGPTEKFPFTNP